MVDATMNKYLILVLREGNPPDILHRQLIKQFQALVSKAMCKLENLQQPNLKF